METTILLELDNLSDGLVLDGLQFGSVSLASGYSVTLLNELIRTEQRTDVLSSERGASLGGRHCVMYSYGMFRGKMEGKLFAAVSYSPAAI